MPASAAAAAPLDVEPQLGRVTLPPLNRPHGKAAGPLPVAASAPGKVASPPPDAALAPGTAAATGAPSFAVSTRIVRTRAESEQLRLAIQALLTAAGARDVRVEIVPAGADWRVVGWPFAKRDEADRARALLASRGMRVEVLDF